MVDPPLAVASLERIDEVADTAQLAQLLRHLRRRQARQRGGPELTYRKLAAKTGWSIGILAGYFGGRVLPPTDRFDVLIQLLDATPSERGALASARDRAQENRRQSGPPPARRPVPRQLPAASFRFAGRGRELAELDGLIGREWPVPAGTIAVLSGTAGVGKTSLSLHWAHRLADHFPDGQLFVNLCGFDPDRPPVDPAAAVRDFLDAFGVPANAIPHSHSAQVSLYRTTMAGLRVLIVLDNARDAEQIRPLLPGASGCLTVVTSRNQLTGLIAVEGAHHVELDLMPLGEARDLMAYRLGAQRMDAEPEVADEIITLCARLPLAMALVAARACAHPAFSLAAVADELRRAQGTLDPFTGEDPAADARAAFSCSYRRLDGVAAALFRWLGWHPGPDVTAPAAASLAGVPLSQVRLVLARLTRAHLLLEHIPGRYAMHDLLRTFAIEQAHRFDGEGERRAAIRRTLDHHLHSAYGAAVLMYPGRDPIILPPLGSGATVEPLGDRDAAQIWFEAEHRVLVGAVSLAAGCGLGAHAWQLAWTLADYLDWRGHWHDLAAVHRVALDAAESTADKLGQVHARRGFARACNRLGRYDDAQTHLDRATELCREIGDPITEAQCHLNASLTLERRGRYRLALDRSRQAQALFRAAGHQAGLAASLGIVGWYHALLGEHDQALLHCQAAVTLQRELGTPHELPSTLDSLAYVYHRLGRHGEASAAYQRAVDLYRAVGDRFNEADTLIHLGDCHHAAGAKRRALGAWQRAVEILDDLSHPAADSLRSRCRLRSADGDRPQLAGQRSTL